MIEKESKKALMTFFTITIILFVWEYLIASKSPPTNLYMEKNGDEITLRWHSGFGIAHAYEVYVREKGSEEKKLVAVTKDNNVSFSLLPGSYEIFVIAIRPSGPSLPSKSLNVTITPSPPQITTVYCEKDKIVIIGKNIDECSFSKDNIEWTKLQPYKTEFKNPFNSSSILIKCFNRFGLTQTFVACKR